MKNKLNSRNVIVKLDGRRLGSNPNVLRTSTLGLMDNVVEYCTPVWMRTHCNKVNVQLNQAMEIMTVQSKACTPDRNQFSPKFFY